jgi:NAD(P)-dependent dehydrogenase (short-subunit alcohol dehydrogenase family)
MTSQQQAHPGRLEGQVAVVTGAGRGIGQAVARRLAAEGAAVVVDDVAADAVEQTVELIRGDGGVAAGVVADAADAAGVEQIFATAEREHGPVTILVNNAGLIGQTRHFLEADEAWWDRLLTTNLKSVFLNSHRAATAMAAGKGGTIVSTSSGGATNAHRGEVAYDASKGGIEAATRAMALDLAPYAIRVNAVAPGSIDVSGGATPADVLAARGETIPLRRVGTPEDLAGAYAFLVSDDARYVTGVVLSVDGGMVAQQRSPQVDVFGLDRFPDLPPAPAPPSGG